MLVLSRKEKQKILFPNLGVSVQICRIDGNAVRVGVEAPPDVRILRDELAPEDPPPPGGPSANPAPLKLRHELRNRLNSANLALHLLQKQLDAGRLADAECTLTRALDQFSELEKSVGNSAMALPHQQPPCRSRRALLVEDNAQERELLAGFLRMNGYEVDAVEDGLAAMSYLSQGPRPDLVLLDMQMPRLDGRQTLSAIRCNPAYRGLKVFAVTGSDRRSLQIRTGPDGVDRWFSKPLSPTQFVSDLESELARDGAAV